MAGGNRSVSIGGDAEGNVIVTGDENSISARTAVRVTRDELPPAQQVDILAELRALKEMLGGLAGEDRPAVEAAVSEAEAFARKPEPPKDRVGAALERALSYAGSAEKLSEHADKLLPRLKAVCGWLGENWHKLLPLAGVALV